MNHTFAYLIAYDVSDDVNRAQLAELLLDLGGTRLQESVFAVDLDAAGLTRFDIGARGLIDPAIDKVNWYRTCGNCPGVVARTPAAILPPHHRRGDAWIV